MVLLSTVSSGMGARGGSCRQPVNCSAGGLSTRPPDSARVPLSPRLGSSGGQSPFARIGKLVLVTPETASDTILAGAQLFDVDFAGGLNACDTAFKPLFPRGFTAHLIGTERIFTIAKSMLCRD